MGSARAFCDSQAVSFRDPEFADVTHLLALQGCDNGIDDLKKNNQSQAERHTLLDQSRKTHLAWREQLDYCRFEGLLKIVVFLFSR